MSRASSRDCSSLSPVPGTNYAFVRTTTNNTGNWTDQYQELSPSIPDGYYLCGLNNGWNLSDCIRLEEGDSGFYSVSNVEVSANAQFKVVKVGLNNGDPAILLWHKYGGAESLMPSRYSIVDAGGNDHNFKIIEAATYTITASSINESAENCHVTIDPEVTLTLKVGETVVGTFDRDDDGKGAGVASQYSISGYTSVQNEVIAIFDGESLVTVINDSGDFNNVWSDGGNLKFSIAINTKIYLKFYTDSTNRLYQEGGSPNAHGVKTGLKFYVYDPNDYWNEDNPDIYLKFLDPNDQLHSKVQQIKCTRSDADKSWICTVPGVDGPGTASATWTRIHVFRCQSGTEPGSAGQWNYITDLSAMNQGYYNSIRVEAKGNDNGSYYLYSDGGLASGTGIYVDPTSAWGKWNMSAEGYGLYLRFYGIVGGDDAEQWTGPMSLVPGETSLYEIEVPKYEHIVNGVKVYDSVEWGSVIIVYNNTIGWNGNSNQSQQFVYSENIKNNHHFTFTDRGTPEWYSEATSDNLYNDTSRANSWGSRFVSSSAGIGVKCNGGVTPPSSTEWDTMGEELDQASRAVKNIVKTATANVGGTGIEQGVARYDYIIHIYGTDTYDDYAERTDTANGGAYAYGAIRNNRSIYGLGVVDDNTPVILIIVASSISILSITALSILVIKKRKSKEQ